MSEPTIHQQSIRHVQEPLQQSAPDRAYLSDQEYGRALDTLVIACVDVVLCWGDRVLLGCRNQDPRRGWWIVGGRMQVGESPMQTTQRKLQDEANLRVEGDRIQFIGVYSTQFATRRQPPTHHGLHSINLVHTVRLTDAESQQVNLTPTEYDQHRWIRWGEIQALLNTDDVMDQYLLTVLRDVQRAGGIEA
jgi:ADP-ribose pyrophosphatase YjhB (NUDIX family)